MKNSRNKNNSSYVLARKSYIHPYIFPSFLLNKYIFIAFVNITQYTSTLYIGDG